MFWNCDLDKLNLVTPLQHLIIFPLTSSDLNRYFKKSILNKCASLTRRPKQKLFK